MQKLDWRHNSRFWQWERRTHTACRRPLSRCSLGSSRSRLAWHLLPSWLWQKLSLLIGISAEYWENVVEVHMSGHSWSLQFPLNARLVSHMLDIVSQFPKALWFVMHLLCAVHASIIRVCVPESVLLMVGTWRSCAEASANRGTHCFCCPQVLRCPHRQRGRGC